MRRLAALTLAVLAAGCGHAVTKPRPGRASDLFGYDRSAPLRFRDRGAVNPAYPIRVHDVSFASPKGGRVTGYLVLPPVRGRKPAVIFMHGSGGDRRQFLPVAGWLAAHGAVGLTLDAPGARAPHPIAPGVRGLRQQRD